MNEFRRQIIAMLRAGRGEEFEPQVTEPAKATRGRRRRSSRRTRDGSTMGPEIEPHAGDNGDQAGAD